jgi:CelD/BcsL family acetyltransferase involved in cellulose biosynthesis/glycosyltransferase involved in cell wall biosynthesis
MRLTVLNVAYPLAPVSPDAVGGAEQVLAAIDRALVAGGHRSLVIAQEGSRCAGALLPIPAHEGPIDELALARAQGATRQAVAAALRAERVDVVHLHGIDFHRYAPEREEPVIATLHLPPEWYPAEAFELPGVRLVCVSESQRRRCPPGARLLPDVENGVDVDWFAPARTRRRFALALGRICPEKGFHFALRAARTVGLPLLLAGRVFDYEVHRRYFAQEISPLLDERRRFIGPIGAARKRRLLGAARCLVVPSLAAETSSLVAMEALASGTPVVAYPAGALAQIVDHGRTGFIVRHVDELGEAMLRAAELRPEDCRAAAEGRFSEKRMTDRYLALYGDLAPARRREARLAIEELRGAEALRRLQPEWLALWERCLEATPFQHPAWLLPWCAHLARAEPVAVALRRHGRLVGLALVDIRRERDGDVLRLLGSGVTDHLDVLLDLAEPDGTAEAMADALRARCDHAELAQLRPSSPLLRTKGPAARVCDTAPALRISPTLDAVPPRRLRELRYLRRRAERDAGARIETAAAADLDGRLDSLFGLHAARWRARGQDGVLASPDVQRFHRDAARRLLAAGLLRMYALRLEGRTAAVFHGFAARDRTSYYLSGFDPAFERFSPGTLVVGHAIEEAAREGAAEFDFLRGGEPYKYRWGARDRPCYAVRLGSAAPARTAGGSG